MSGGLSPTIAFGEFEFDAQRRRLSRVGAVQAVHLKSRAAAALLHLAARPGTLVTKAELMEAVWPDVTVEENSLAQCVSLLRKALGERPGEHRYIVTEPGRGYRFIAGGSAVIAPAVGVARNPLAYQYYVRGWAALTRPGTGNIRNGLEQLERAVMIDPDFTLAHVCIADGYALLGVFGAEPPHAVFPEARKAVRRALQLDPLSAEAHAELAHIRFVYDLAWGAAEVSLRRAEQIDPRSILTQHYLGLLKIAQGRFDDALDHLYRAQAEEPLAPNICANIGMCHYFAGRYHEAIAQLEAALDVDPGFAHALSFLGRTYLRVGRIDEALAQFAKRRDRAIASEADVPSALALAGQTAQAEAALDDLLSQRGERYVGAFEIATIQAALGRTDAALDWLQTAFEERAQYVMFMRWDPSFAALRLHPRFERIAAQLGVQPPIEVDAD